MPKSKAESTLRSHCIAKGFTLALKLYGMEELYSLAEQPLL